AGLRSRAGRDGRGPVDGRAQRGPLAPVRRGVPVMPPSPTPHPLIPGKYPFHLVRQHLLQATPRQLLHAVRLLFFTPRQLTCRDWWRTENQGPVGRCAGMGSSSCGEWLYRAATGKLIQFNGHYSYIKAQKYTPSLFGRDGGSTIH